MLGDFNAATNAELLSKLCIRTIVTAAAGLEHLEIDPSVEHITYPLADLKSENIAAFFDESYRTIEESTKEFQRRSSARLGVSSLRCRSLPGTARLI